MNKYTFILTVVFLFSNQVWAQSIFARREITLAARDVIAREIGSNMAKHIDFEPLETKDGNPAYEYRVKNSRLIIKGTSVVALCHGFYDYLKTSNQGMVTWSGRNIQIVNPWKYVTSKRVVSPYRYHYYMNVVTHGYSTPYWGWDRWQQELDWMALHGMDMLMLNSAYEAIMFRVFRKIGLPEIEIRKFFTGPAFQPWNRMGNVADWDGPPPVSWYARQIALTHQVITRMKMMGITPIIQSFAGFVPKGITTIDPSAKVTSLFWNSHFPEQNQCYILLPDSANAPLFIKIGKLFVQEWEKEFGKGEYFLSDCFNEMHVPKTGGESEVGFQKELTEYGRVVYTSLKEGDSTAVWTMQGWTFGYQRSDWNEGRLSALVAQVPDDKVLFLDLANDYNIDFWHISTNWRYYHGFFNKQWIYSFIPDMGGEMPWNGILKTYAEAPIKALNYSGKGNLIGFGFAPEGIENNELIYELLTDIGWSNKKIDLNSWLRSYCIQRYGSYPLKMKEAYQYFLRSCYGTFTDHPRFRYQLSADGKEAGTVNNNPLFFKGVKCFLSCSSKLEGSELYRNDAIELASQYLSLDADSLIKKGVNMKGESRYRELDEAWSILDEVDRILESDPNDRLERWVNYAKSFGNTAEEKHYYAEDARRIITTWGPGISDYSARMWSGLISSYYVQRMKMFYYAEENHKKFDLSKWEENWVETGTPKRIVHPFSDPIAVAKIIISKLH